MLTLRSCAATETRPPAIAQVRDTSSNTRPLALYLFPFLSCSAEPSQSPLLSDNTACPIRASPTQSHKWPTPTVPAIHLGLFLPHLGSCQLAHLRSKLRRPFDSSLPPYAMADADTLRLRQVSVCTLTTPTLTATGN